MLGISACSRLQVLVRYRYLLGLVFIARGNTCTIHTGTKYRGFIPKYLTFPKFGQIYQYTSLFEISLLERISIPYQYTSFWGSDIPIYLMFSENSSNIPIYRMHDLGAQKGHTNIPHVFEKWPNIPIYLNLTSTRKLLQAHCYIGIYPT